MNDKEATAKLNELVARAGQLQIITAVPDPTAETDDPRDPRYFVLEVVDDIERQPNGVLMAVGHNGSFTLGKPLDLLVRLLEWQHYDPEQPLGTQERVLAALT